MDSFTKNQVATLGVSIANGEDTKTKRDIVLAAAESIFLDRNGKYKDAWRDYRYSTFVDRNLVKAKRLRSLDEAGDKFEMFEQAMDQINELAFLAILLAEDIAANEIVRKPINLLEVDEVHCTVPPMAEVNAIKEEQEEK